jgi:hypothetical protein
LLSGALTDQDEADVEAELEALVSATLPDIPFEELPAAAEEPSQLPDVPSHEPGEHLILLKQQ